MGLPQTMWTWFLLRAAVPWHALAEPLYLDPLQDIWDRVEDLMNLMTLEEKIAQTWAVHKDLPWVLGLNAATGYGEQKLTGFTVSSAAELLEKRNTYQGTVLSQSRHGIPLSFNQETLASGSPDGTGRYASSLFVRFTACFYRFPSFHPPSSCLDRF